MLLAAVSVSQIRFNICQTWMASLDPRRQTTHLFEWRTGIFKARGGLTAVRANFSVITELVKYIQSTIFRDVVKHLANSASTADDVVLKPDLIVHFIRNSRQNQGTALNGLPDHQNQVAQRADALFTLWGIRFGRRVKLPVKLTETAALDLTGDAWYRHDYAITIDGDGRYVHSERVVQCSAVDKISCVVLCTALHYTRPRLGRAYPEALAPIRLIDRRPATRTKGCRRLRRVSPPPLPPPTV